MNIIAVRVNNNAASAIRKGHPWIFSDSIVRINRESAAAGDVAVVYDDSGKKFLGAGLFDPSSPIRVRILTRGKSEPVGGILFRSLLNAAAKRREGLLPPDTTAWRLVNGESDSFSGLVADRYEDTVVLKIYSAAWLPHLSELEDAFRDTFAFCKRLVFRYSRELFSKVLPFPEGTVHPPCPEWDGFVTFRENGILFRADVIRGQKTGFFLDQRGNRARVGALSNGKTVLNVFSFSGGFSLYAAKGGASAVASVDLDRHAMEAVKEHFELNSNLAAVRRCPHEEFQGDAFQVMRTLAESGRRFDMVIVDPPSFAKAGAEVSGALNTYGRLASFAVKLLKKNGMLVFASCSSRVHADELFPAVVAAASRMGVRLEEVERTAHEVDHPALFRESSYLKCAYYSRIG